MYKPVHKLLWITLLSLTVFLFRFPVSAQVREHIPFVLTSAVRANAESDAGDSAVSTNEPCHIPMILIISATVLATLLFQGIIVLIWNLQRLHMTRKLRKMLEQIEF